MKAARLVLKIVAGALALAAAVCCVIAFWDKIEEAFYCLRDKVRKIECSCDGECDDFVDWDAE